MITATPIALSDELDLNGRKYTVFGSLARLAVPLLLLWAITAFLSFLAASFVNKNSSTNLKQLGAVE
jgi:hypothetical protein